jgi:RHS repeat-associated protein
VDFLGRDTACVLWSSPLPADQQRPLRYVDLMRGTKPHLLTRMANNLGAETVIEYASSTEFYLADQAAGHPWVTRLPFPVYVVKRTESYDRVSHSRFVTSSTYHHGYYDGVEREFRGFGRVEQIDRERFHEGAFPCGSNEDAAWSVPPVLTKTWYHTGVFLGVDRVTRHLAHEYYHEPHESGAMLLEDTVLPGGLTPEEVREACRALKGSVLRSEIYALDETEESGRPYKASESNSTIRLLQPRDRNRHAVFLTHARESVSFHYERKLYEIGGVRRADPRVAHNVTLEADKYGNALRSVVIGYGRRFPDPKLLTDVDLEKQSRILVTLVENRFTNAVERPDDYRTPAAAEMRKYELFDVYPRAREFGVTNLFRFAELRRVAEHARRGLFHASRSFYRSDDLQSLLELGRLESRALPGESYRLVLTPEILRRVYRRGEQELFTDPAETLGKEGGYVDLDHDGCWWASSGVVRYSPHAEDAQVELAYAKRHFYLPHRYVDPFGNTTRVGYDRHDLAAVETRDAAGNETRARLDYRVLTPVEVTDPNGNRTEAAYDALGMVAGVAVMGKKGQNAGDSLEGFIADLPQGVVLEHLRHPFDDAQRVLGKATSRMLYDLFAFDRTRGEDQPQPAVTYTMARETHVSDLKPGEETKIQHSFAYSDGFGREIQKKIQAEPEKVREDDAAVEDRWIGSGWTIFNNKGKPVRNYEPFFSHGHGFEFAAIRGVSPTIFYDPVERVVATLHPDRSYEKTVFDPWQQANWDGNDTVLEDPREDRDAGEYFRRIPEADYLPTWYQQRESGAMGPAEQEAARKSAQHAGTPSLAYPDSLGRTFLTIAHNRFEQAGETREEFYATRSDLDIQGHPLAVIDALGRTIMTYAYDVTGSQIYQNCADSGGRWTVMDIAGKPLLAWDSRDFRFRYEYDALRRAVRLFVKSGDDPEKLCERTEYGEEHADAKALNLRTQLYRQWDEAGVSAHEEYDFKGNLQRGSRQLLADYKNTADWAASPALEEEVFFNSNSYDALNRPVTMTTPDGSVIRPVFNARNLLGELAVRMKGADEFAPYVRRVTYNSKGQRERIEYANGAETTSHYDPLTFRLVHLKTTRQTDDEDLQDVRYSYDPIGNIAHIADSAQQTVYFKNQVVPASADYTYDAIYRLMEAAGREHAGNPEDPATSYNDVPRVHLILPGDGHAMRRYREHYEYDAVGNIRELIHAAGNQTWRRHYHYGDIHANNRVSSTAVGKAEDHYDYDAAGNMTRMQHLPSMKWDFRNELASIQTHVVNSGAAETTYYVYDSAGQRVRKVTDGSNGKRRAERIYLGGFEIYREYRQDPALPETECATLHVMDGERRIALVETRGEVSTIRYQFSNYLASACLELDDQAEVVSYEEYYPYGCSSYQAGRSLVEVSLKRYRFTGKERDNETGFYYHGVRYYAPWIGRWTSSDPKGLVDGSNTYGYARDNPVFYSDASGKQCDPSTQSCVDPTEPTPEEESLQACLAPPDATDAPLESSSDEDSSSSNEAALVSTAISADQYIMSQMIRPVDVNGNPLEGTYYLWSDAANGAKLNKDAAKAMIASEGGWLMNQTPQHAAAEILFVDALRQQAAVKFPGQTFTDAQLFAIAGPGKALELPTAEFRSIWDPPSADVAWRAALGGLPVQGNMVTPAANDTVQFRIEQPAVARGGAIMGGLQVGAGVLNIYGGTQEQDSTLSALGIGGGTLQVVGGSSWILGALRTSAPLMSFGSKASIVGSVITAPIVLSHASDDWNSGDQSRQLGAALDVTGIVAPPAAFLSAYNKYFVQPAAKTFYDISRHDIAQMLGVPQSWVY